MKFTDRVTDRGTFTGDLNVSADLEVETISADDEVGLTVIQRLSDAIDEEMDAIEEELTDGDHDE